MCIVACTAISLSNDFRSSARSKRVADTNTGFILKIGIFLNPSFSSVSNISYLFYMTLAQKRNKMKNHFKMIDSGRLRFLSANPIQVSATFFNLAEDQESLEYMINVHNV